jgi:Fe-S oxidoreductase
MSAGYSAFANSLRYVQGAIAEQLAKARGIAADNGGQFEPNSAAAQYYEGYYDGLKEAQRINAEIFNKNAHDGRVVR